jgi:hypothetical protein
MSKVFAFVRVHPRKSNRLSVNLNDQFLRKASSFAVNFVWSFKVLSAIVLLLLFSVHSEAQKNNSKETPKPQIFVTPATGGPIEKENYKKRTPEEIFEALNAVVRAMSNDMEEFNFDRVHPHLKIIYALFNELRLLSLDNIDSVIAHPVKADSTLAKRSTGSANFNVSTSQRSPSVRAEGSLAGMVIDTSNLSGSSPSSPLSIKPLIDLKNIEPLKNRKDSAAVGKLPSLSFSWDDTSFQKYMLKFEMTPDSAGNKGWNVVFEKVDKLKNKTVKIHQYFDVGEFSVSAQDLVWLTDELKKSETDMLGYFYWKEHEKKIQKKDTIFPK